MIASFEKYLEDKGDDEFWEYYNGRIEGLKVALHKIEASMFLAE